MLVWHGQLFVGLAQRSNVETLTLAFFLVFFAYIAVISAPGAWGALRVLRFDLERHWAGDPLSVEQKMAARLGPPRAEAPIAALNRLLERDGMDGQAFDLAITDTAGSQGSIRVDGAQMTHFSKFGEGSNSLLAFVVHQVNSLITQRGEQSRLDVVEWQTIDDESAQKYLSSVHFARNLERTLNAGELWPKTVLTGDECWSWSDVSRRSALHSDRRVSCRIGNSAASTSCLSSPSRLAWYPFGRSERRVDPLASMGCAVIVVVGIVIILGLFILFPPWVPGV